MSTKFLSPGWRMPRNANQNKQVNYSLSFDSSSSQDISFTTPAPFNGATLNNFDCSFSVWANFNSVNQFGALICFGQFDLEIAPVTSTQVGIWIDNSALAGVLHTPSLNIWYHYVMTKSGNTYSLYVDGVLIGSGTDSDNATVGSPSFIGSNGGFGAGRAYFDGELNGAAIFDYALSSSQITTLYGDSTNGPGNPMALPNTPIAYYPLGTSAWNGDFLAENNAIGDYVFDFPSSTNYIDLGTNPFSFTQNLTVSFWMKSTQINVSNTLIAKDVNSSGKRNWAVMIYQNKIYFWTTPAGSVGTLNDIQGTTAGAVSDGKWHHIVCVNDYTNSTKQIYIDGNLDITNNKGAAISTSNADVWIGRRPSGFQYDGEMSNMLLWDKALTATEAQTLYNYGSPIQTLANIPQNSNLKAWYKLDASEIYNSSITDWEINQATADYTSSLSFPGVVGDLLKIPNSSTFVPTNNLTFSFWVNHTTTTSSRDARVFSVPKNSNYEGMYLMDNNDGKMRFTTSSDGNTYNRDTYTAIVVNDGKWHHIVCTFDASGDIKVYTDNGTPNTNNNPGTFTIPASTDMGIGGKFTGTGSFEKFAGLISNGSVWNKALSASEVSEVYNSGQPGNLSSHSASSNLVAWWKMDNLTTGIQDSSTNSNNGTAFDLSVQPGSVSTLNGESSGMTQANLIQSDLQTVAPYSKYAMKLDDATLSDYINVPNNSTLQITGNLTLSSWVKIDGSYISNGHLIAKTDSYVLKSHQGSLSNVPRFQVNDGTFINLEGPSALSLDTWHHIAGVREGNSLKLYVNGALVASSTPTIGNLSVNTNPVQFNAYTSGFSSDLSLSNNAIWNVALNASEIREVYNEGLPSNLNTFSGTAPISWWQLGENSSFDGSNWKYADEMTAGNNADSVNTAETALTNGVGTTANGTSNGIAVGALVGNAPYSTANAISSGMSVVSRVTGSGNTP